MKMSAEARAKVLFAAFLAALAAAGAAWYVLTARHSVVYEIDSVDSVSGLIAGAPVEFHGVEVGKVSEVQLLDPRNVRILVELDRQAPITSATVATITGRGLATRGFTGYVYVSLEDREAGGRPLLPGPGGIPVIASGPGQALSLDTAISELNRNVQGAVALLNTVLDTQTVASLKESLRSLDAVTRTLAANNARLNAILVNAERASAQMPPLLQSSTRTVSELQTKVLPQAQATLQRLNSLSAASEETIRALQTQVLPEAHRTVERLDRLSMSLNETAGKVRRNPSVLLRGPAVGQPGPGETQ